MEKEIWKGVFEYEGLYQASDLGRIRSLNYKRSGTIRILKPGKYRGGYLHVYLCKDGKGKKCSVHRLVWEAFNGKIPPDMQVNHINEDKTDNRLENLNLMTCKENINWGTGVERSAESKSKCVLQFTLDDKFVREWTSTMECGRHGFKQSAVSECCRNCYLREGNNIYKGFIWMFASDFFKMLPEL